MEDVAVYKILIFNLKRISSILSATKNDEKFKPLFISVLEMRGYSNGFKENTWNFRRRKSTAKKHWDKINKAMAKEFDSQSVYDRNPRIV